LAACARFRGFNDGQRGNTEHNAKRTPCADTKAAEFESLA